MSHITARRSGAILVLAAAVLAPVISAAPAQAKSSPAIVRSGACAGGGVWHLKAKHDNNRISIEFEVDTNRVGQVWRVGVSDNNHQVFLGQRRTIAPSGSFVVRTSTLNRVGADTIRARAGFGTRSCAGAVRL